MDNSPSNQIETTASEPNGGPVPVQQPVVSAISTPIPSQERKKSSLPIWALVLSIIGLVTAAIVFVSIPLTIVALILGIIALKKQAGSKGMSIAGLVISAVTLIFIVPFMLLVTLVAFNGITERANQTTIQAKNLAAGDRLVEQPCFTFTAPVNYSFVEGEENCSAVLSGGSGTLEDQGRYILVGVVNEDISTEEKYIDYAEKVTKQDFNRANLEKRTVNGYEVYTYNYTNTNDTPVQSNVIIDESGIHSYGDSTITGYVVLSDIVLDEREEDMQEIISTFIIKRAE